MEVVVTLSLIAIDQIKVSTYTVPTDFPESDGTLQWNSTTLVLVHAHGGNKVGLGYTYADTATANLIRDTLSKTVEAQNAMSPAASWNAMVACTRNLGRPGIVSMAISAVDIALWDLKARLLHVPLLTLLGVVRESMPIYGSGGFTSYSEKQLQNQLARWVEQGITRVKMKIGRDAKADIGRVAAARDAIGPATELFVDANGAYSRKRLWPKRKDSRSRMSLGSRSPFLPTILQGYGCCEIDLLPAWKLLPANTDTIPDIFAACLMQGPSTFCS